MRVLDVPLVLLRHTDILVVAVYALQGAHGCLASSRLQSDDFLAASSSESEPVDS